MEININNKTTVAPYEDLEFMNWFNDSNMAVFDINIIYKGWLAAKQYMLNKSEKTLCLETGEQIYCVRKNFLTMESNSDIIDEKIN